MATDDFTGTADPLPSPWAPAGPFADLQKDGGTAFSSLGTDGDAGMQYSSSSVTRSVGILAVPGGRDGGVWLVDSACNGYITNNFSLFQAYLFRLDAGSYVGPIDTADPVVPWAADDKIAIFIDSGDVVVEVNDVEVLRAADTTHRTGLHPGIGAFSGDMEWASWTDDAGGGVAVTGTGALTSPAATITGGSHRIVSGSGGSTAPAATLSGDGTRGVVSVESTPTSGTPVVTIAGTGTVNGEAQEVTGTGDLSIAPVTVAGSGTVNTDVENITGTGALTGPSATVGSTAVRGITGTGALQSPSVLIGGSGVRLQVVTGSGALTAPRARISGGTPSENPVVGPGVRGFGVVRTGVVGFGVSWAA